MFKVKLQTSAQRGDQDGVTTGDQPGGIEQQPGD